MSMKGLSSGLTAPRVDSPTPFTGRAGVYGRGSGRPRDRGSVWDMRRPCDSRRVLHQPSSWGDVPSRRITPRLQPESNRPPTLVLPSFNDPPLSS